MRRIVLLIIWITVSILSAKTDCHFAVLSDRAGGVNHQAFTQIVTEINRLQPDFIVTVGDLSDNCEEDQYIQAMEVMKTVNIPVFYTPGNNDIQDDKSAALFTKYTGKPPYYAFNHQQSHFIIMNNAIAEKFTEIDSVQMRWLKNDLEQNKNAEEIYVFMHKPFWAEKQSDMKANPMHTLFSQYPVKAVFAGHWHQFAHDQIGQIDYYMAGSSGGGFENPDDQLGKFYQFLWCRVKDHQLMTSVIKSGNIFPSDLMTIQEENLDYDIENNAVNISATYDKNKAVIQVSIKNITDKPIHQLLKFDHNNHWTISEKEIMIDLAPQQVFKKEIKATYTTVYPLPKYSFDYPFGRDKLVHFNFPIKAVPHFIVQSLSKKPVIDGKISSKEYARGCLTESFADEQGEVSDIEKTLLYLGRDQENLYIAFEAIDSHPDSIKTKAKNDDNVIFSDDSFGLLLSQEQNTVYQIYINPASAIWDMKCDLKNYDFDLKWNLKAKSAFSIKKATVTGELQIPYTELGFDVNKPININFRRVQTDRNTKGMLNPVWDLDIRNHGILECYIK